MSQPRVLIVDDASLVRLYYRDALQRAGYHTEEALNGLEALEKLLVEPADLILVDINMPTMDGMTFLRTLRRQAPPMSAIPAIVTSTEATSKDAALARAAGANFYLVKPVPQETVVLYVDLLCGRLSSTSWPASPPSSPTSPPPWPGLSGPPTPARAAPDGPVRPGHDADAESWPGSTGSSGAARSGAEEETGRLDDPPSTRRGKPT